MTSVILSTLVNVPLIVTFSNRESLPVRPGSWFELPIVLTIKGENSLDWTPQNSLKLSYRWLDQDGNMVEREGRRTEIPSGFLAPGARLELDLGGVSPEEAGLYELQVSLVLEGVHWACDLGDAGWVQRFVQVSTAPAWPDKLGQSRGGRALRGALVAREIAWLLHKRPLVMSGEVTDIENKTLTASLDSRAIKPPTFVRRLGNRFRALLGISGLERQLDDVLTLANQQDEHAQDLEKQLALLREELLAGLNRSQIDPPQVLEDVSDARKKLSAKLLSRKKPTRAYSGKEPSRLIEPRSKTRKVKGISGTSVP